MSEKVTLTVELSKQDLNRLENGLYLLLREAKIHEHPHRYAGVCLCITPDARKEYLEMLETVREWRVKMSGQQQKMLKKNGLGFYE
jgi:hypothetical protein